jgi:hypothetical protein
MRRLPQSFSPILDSPETESHVTTSRVLTGCYRSESHAGNGAHDRTIDGGLTSTNAGVARTVLFRYAVRSHPLGLLDRAARDSPHSHSSAHVAQLVEHFLGKEEVTGSIPVVSPMRRCSDRASSCGSNSVGRVTAFQAVGRGFESRLPLLIRNEVPTATRGARGFQFQSSKNHARHHHARVHRVQAS